MLVLRPADAGQPVKGKGCKWMILSAVNITAAPATYRLMSTGREAAGAAEARLSRLEKRAMSRFGLNAA